MTKANFLVEKWQGLLQQVVLYVGRGYYFSQVFSLPEKKREKWSEVDRKILNKFEADKSRFQRARQKNKGTANFVYLRWEHLAVVLHTMGSFAPEVCLEGECFQDVRKQPLRLMVGKETIFQVTYKDKVDVCLVSDTYKGIKAVVHDAAKMRSKVAVKRELQKLSGLPGYAGVNQQKKQLAHFARRQLLKHQVRVEPKEFSLWLGKKMYKVFCEDE